MLTRDFFSQLKIRASADVPDDEVVVSYATRRRWLAVLEQTDRVQDRPPAILVIALFATVCFLGWLVIR